LKVVKAVKAALALLETDAPEALIATSPIGHRLKKSPEGI
jgi:hypothetical protein